MTWIEMKKAEPQLRVLETEARNFGRDGRTWWATWTSELYEPLTKLVGHGSTGRLRSAKDFEAARKSLLMAWANPDGLTNIPPWEVAEHETEPLPPAFGQPSAPCRF